MSIGGEEIEGGDNVCRNRQSTAEYLQLVKNLDMMIALRELGKVMH